MDSGSLGGLWQEGYCRKFCFKSRVSPLVGTQTQFWPLRLVTVVPRVGTRTVVLVLISLSSGRRDLSPCHVTGPCCIDAGQVTGHMVDAAQTGNTHPSSTKTPSIELGSTIHRACPDGFESPPGSHPHASPLRSIINHQPSPCPTSRTWPSSCPSLVSRDPREQRFWPLRCPQPLHGPYEALLGE